MPLALNPKAKFTVVLKSDLHKTTKERPVFLYRYLNGHEWDQVASSSDRLQELKEQADAEGKDANSIVFEAAGTGLVGWKNMIDPKTKKGIPFRTGVKQLKKIVGQSEALELIGKILQQQKPTEKDLKKFG